MVQWVFPRSLLCQKHSLLILVVMDDGDLFIKTMRMIGLSFVTMLDEVDWAGLLKPDSRIKDLGLIMACSIHWSNSWK